MSNGRYPRSLHQNERKLLEFVLPLESPGYALCRELIAGMVVLGEGKQGKGNLLLGTPGARPDLSSPPEPVIAYGAVETSGGTVSIAVRRPIARQIEIEIGDFARGSWMEFLEEGRRWTYSTWRPGEVSPQQGGKVREVLLTENLLLAISSEEKRLWVYDRVQAMNLLIPITSFYGELMSRKRIRDSAIALHPNRLFDDLSTYTDEDLRSAFHSYNSIHPKVEFEMHVDHSGSPIIRRFLTRIFARRSSHG